MINFNSVRLLRKTGNDKNITKFQGQNPHTYISMNVLNKVKKK